MRTRPTTKRSAAPVTARSTHRERMRSADPRFFEGGSALPRSRPPRERAMKNTKTCRQCGERKNGSEFPRNRRMSDGLSSWCGSCHAEATQRWREQNPQQVDAYNAKRRALYAAEQAAQREQRRLEDERRAKELRRIHEDRKRRVERERKGKAPSGGRRRA